MTLVAVGLVVRPAVAETPASGPVPALEFTFLEGTGRPVSVVTLVVADVEAFVAAKTVKDAANSAVREAKERRRARGLE